MGSLSISLERANEFYAWGWRLSIVGAVATAIGVGLLMWGTRVRDHDFELRMTQANGDAAKANQNAAAARERAATAELQAAQARLELAKFKAPRILSQEQQVRIADKLKSFSGTVYDAGIGPMGDPEPLYILRSIHAALSLANWNQIAWTGGGQTYTEAGMPSVGLTMVTNVIVDVHPEHWKELGPAAAALAAALMAEGIDAIADSKSTSIDTDAIHIRIGRKL